MPNVTVTLDTSVTTPLDPGAVGIGISTYGSNLVRNSTQAEYLGKQGHRFYRLPIQWNGGNPISSARGGPGDISADEWVSKIQEIGGVVYLQIGGKDTDMDFSPEDAAGLVRHFAPRGVTYFGVGNEPNNLGWNMDQYLDLYNRCTGPMRQAAQDVGIGIKIGGPVWSYYDRGRNQQFLDQANDVDVLEYHHYAMGNPPAMSDEDTLAHTVDWGNECREVIEDARARGKGHVIPIVGEANWAWQYRDGYSGTGDGADTRFFQPIITAWMASVIGHGLANHGWVWQYSDQNGPLGITVEPGNTDQGKPGNTPQPVYHGVGAWTGEGVFPGVSDTMYKAQSSSDQLEAWAVKNTDGGVNLILVNKSTTTDLNVDVISDPDNAGVEYKIFKSNTNDAYQPFGQDGEGELGGTITTTVPRVGVVVISAVGAPTSPVDPPEASGPIAVTWAKGPSATPGGTEVALDGRVARINAGDAVDNWQSSAAVVSGGSVSTRQPTGDIYDLGDGETVEGIFDSEIWGNHTWTVTLPADVVGVAVDLLFMERFEGSQATGSRLFDLGATYGDAELSASSVDVFAAFGTNPGGVVCVLVPSAPAEKVVINLAQGSRGDNPFVNAVRIRLLSAIDDGGGNGGGGGGGGNGEPPPEDDLFTHLADNASLDDVIVKVNGILDYIKPVE